MNDDHGWCACSDSTQTCSVVVHLRLFMQTIAPVSSTDLPTARNPYFFDRVKRFHNVFFVSSDEFNSAADWWVRRIAWYLGDHGNVHGEIRRDVLFRYPWNLFVYCGRIPNITTGWNKWQQIGKMIRHAIILRNKVNNTRREAEIPVENTARSRFEGVGWRCVRFVAAWLIWTCIYLAILVGS